MGQKLSTEQIDQHALDNPNTGFDTCKYCKGVEPQNDMLSFDDSDVIICEECSDSKLNAIEEELGDAIDEVFVTAHQLFESKSGDISPDQMEQLDSLKKQLLDLILTQTKRNL
jgi:hypothetical protein